MPAEVIPGRRVLLSSPFIPPEFIAAHGFLPCRPSAAGSTACHAGRCATAAGFDLLLARSRPGDLAVVASSCDQLRRSGEVASTPVFRFGLPVTWESANAARMYRGELERLGRFLVRHGGSAPDARGLAAHLLDHDDRRARLRTAATLLPARAAAAACAAYAERGDAPGAVPPPLRSTGIPVALLGGPLPGDALAFHDVLEAAGLQVALDGSEGGERGLAAPFDRRRVHDDPLGELVDAYFLSIPDAFRRPDRLLYSWLDRARTERSLRAVVVRLDPWCDLWRGQVPRLKDWGRLPVLAIEAGEEAGAAPRLRTRAEALAEMLACPRS